MQLYKALIKQKEFVISKQLLKSATSIGANIEEANTIQTKKDFIAKMAIASKEARETKYWLKLFDNSQIVKDNYSSFLNEIEFIKILKLKL
ncbi:MAG: four helix bundle protein [Chitinophagaceae bacterium]